MKKFILFSIILCLIALPCLALNAGIMGMVGGSSATVNTNFVSAWDTTKVGASAAKTIALPLFDGGTYNFTVDYGDSSGIKTVTSWNDADATHTYTDDGTYTVTISGTIEGFRFDNGGDKLRLAGISNWGTLKVGTNQGGYFYGCANMVVTATDTLDTSAVTNMSSMFDGASSFNQSVANFDTSAVTDMYAMFYGASSFNQSVANFDTSKVTDMSSMFDGASSFNQSVANFDTSAVTDMYAMFSGASSFNQSVANFDTSKVTDMAYMFYETSLSIANYNALLVSWAADTQQSGVSFHAGSTKYSTGAPATARAVLTGTYGWNITDGGQE